MVNDDHYGVDYENFMDYDDWRKFYAMAILELFLLIAQLGN